MLEHLLNSVSGQFKENSLKAFRGVALEERPVDEVAQVLRDRPAEEEVAFEVQRRQRCKTAQFLRDRSCEGVAAEMHRTNTIDYVVVISGEMMMQLDEGEVRLRAGDVLVQRGTNHNWVNPGPEPCRFAAILIDGARD